MEFSALLERAISLAGGDAGRVFVVSIPDYGYTPFGVNNQSSISDEPHSSTTRAEWNVGAWGGTLQHHSDFMNGPKLRAGAVDRLHPSGVQYGRWVVPFVDKVAGLVHP